MLLALALVLTALGGDNLLKNPDVKGGSAWQGTGGSTGVRFKVDKKVGAEKKGSLFISCTDEGSEQAHNWHQRVELSKTDRPTRLSLSVSVRTAGLGPASRASLMVQLYPEQGWATAFSSCPEVLEDGDWQRIRTVFDVPEDTVYLRTLAYFIGPGEVWFDDFELVETTDPLTTSQSAPRRNEDLARGCAEDLPWVFDADEARERARRETKPILLYVRCTEKLGEVLAPPVTIRADEVGLSDDGYAKDLVFRAGPLSDPDVTTLVQRRFVPLCMTYFLAESEYDGGQLEGLELQTRELVTPALVALDADGTVLRKLHRMGALSAELVDRWLMGVLEETAGRSTSREPEELLLDGRPAAALEALGETKGPAAGLLRARAHLRLGQLVLATEALDGLRGPEVDYLLGRIALRRGEWELALETFEAALSEEDLADPESARFWSAWSLDRLGRDLEAERLWKDLVGESRIGRKAAACLLPSGPRLTLSESVRAWPLGDELPVQTEVGRPEPFDVVQSVTALLELQHRRGSFGGHQGAVNFGHSEPAITAIVTEALRIWEPELPRELERRSRAARVLAVGHLRWWSEASQASGADGFNHPYVLMTLVREKERAAASRIMERLAETQLEDGNWTVYTPDRPASFNTALCTMALIEAKRAGLRLPNPRLLSSGLDALEAMRQKGDLFPYSTRPGHEWMTTEHGSIARDPLCEHALLLGGRGDEELLEAALERYLRFQHELRIPTKRLYDYFNQRGHGGYYFFFAHDNALNSLPYVPDELAARVRAAAVDSVLSAREGDGTFVDSWPIGRAYGTAMALRILAE